MKNSAVSIDDELWEYRQLFINESLEQINVLSELLVLLDSQQHKPQLVDEVFRIVHSIKGASTLMSHDSLTSLAHRLEDEIWSLRQSKVQYDESLRNRLQTFLDQMKSAVTQTCRTSDNHEDMVNLTTMTAAYPCQNMQPEPLPLEQSADLTLAGKYADEAAKTHEHLDAEPPFLQPAPTELSSLSEVTPVPSEIVSLSIRIEPHRIDQLVEKSQRLVNITDEIHNCTEGLEELLQFLQSSRRRKTKKHKTNAKNKSRKKQRSMISERFARLRSLSQLLSADVKDLQHDTRSLRLVPLSQLFHRLRRSVQTVAEDLNKAVKFEIDAGDTCLDKDVVDALVEPLVHLLRNALDHGIEEPEVRGQLGKSVIGTIHLTAQLCDDSIRIEISDDGRGLDTDAIKAAALSCNLLTQESADTLTADQVTELVWKLGVSTARNLTCYSGRGIGLNIVRERIQQLGGEVEVNFEPRMGTTISILLPNTSGTSIRNPSLINNAH